MKDSHFQAIRNKHDMITQINAPPSQVCTTLETDVLYTNKWNKDC